jgi:glycerol kinase
LKTIAFTDNGATDYALEGIIRSCGDTLTWLSSELALGTIEEGIESAFSVNDNEGVYLVPAQLVCSAFWDSDIRAAFSA